MAKRNDLIPKKRRFSKFQNISKDQRYIGKIIFGLYLDGDLTGYCSAF